MQRTDPRATTPAVFHLTGHAATRLQQRGIPQWFVQLLVQHGKTSHDGHSAKLKSISKATRRRLRAVLSHRQYVQAERFFNVYAVVADDGAVITTARRTRRRFH
jgi:hypothetical protein